MNRRLAFVSAAFAIALPLALSGCGNKGPLVLPDPPAPAEPPAADAVPPPANGTPAR